MAAPFDRIARLLITLAAAGASSSALAHPGHGDGALAGLLHPLLGLDHLIAILATGVWIAQLAPGARKLLPFSFVAVMAAAALAALAGLPLPVVEFGILGSLLLAGLLIALRVQLAPAAGALLVSCFALFHGYAHGIELPALAVPWQYFAGFLFATGALLLAGIGAGMVLKQWKAGLPATGTLVFASGGWMLTQLA